MKIPSQRLRERVRREWLITVLLATVSVFDATRGYTVVGLLIAVCAALNMVTAVRLYRLSKSPLLFLVDLEAMAKDIHERNTRA